MNYKKNIFIQERFVYYVQKAVSQGAYIKVNDLLNRFLLAINRSLSPRQKARYVSYLKKYATNFDINLFYPRGQKGRNLLATSIKNSLYKENLNAVCKIAYCLIKHIHAAKNCSIRAYDTLRVMNKASIPTLERTIKTLKANAKRFGVYFYYVGRTLFVRLAYSKLTNIFGQNTHQKNATLILDRKKAKEIYINTPSARLIKNSKKIRNLCFWLVSRLKSFFHDGLKVIFNPRIAYRYVEWGILKGLKTNVILSALYTALHHRNEDATFEGIDTGNITLKYELSSTVSLARTLLRKKMSTCFLSTQA